MSEKETESKRWRKNTHCRLKHTHTQKTIEKYPIKDESKSKEIRDAAETEPGRLHVREETQSRE